ncbi:MAG TPA: DNA polymerase III subunit delta [Nitrospiria bacterium]
MRRPSSPRKTGKTGGLDYQGLIARIDKKQIDPVYFLNGEEDFLVQSALERLTRTVVEPSMKDFNFSVFDGQGASADDIRTALESLPAFTDRRLVILKNAERLAASEANRLATYLTNPSPTTCFVCTARKFDARRAFFQALRTHATVVECQPLSDGQVSSWIRNRARSMGRGISDDAVLFLKERIGRDLFALQNELSKAEISIGQEDNNREIGMEDLEAVCGAAGSATIFDLLNALSGRRSEEAVRAVSLLMEEGEPPLRILSTLVNRFRLTWRVQRGMRSGFSDNALLRQFGLGQWMGRSILAAAKAFREPDLQWAFKRFIETDAGLKGGMLPQKMVMEVLVMDLCAGRKKGLRRFMGRQTLLNL